ncbi:phosphatidate cytidylyltransferase [Candidatus Pelagibacter sp.]|uniref:phosphatidate cytidylyltransferase n=1 Tax=Candidatus Pelagibacter sp. TaxID=2024849 RepID=UPI003F85256E
MINKELQRRILSSIILIPVTIFFIIQGSFTFIFFLSLIFLVTSLEWFKMTKNKDLLRIFGLFFLFFSFFSTFYLRQYIGLNFFLFLIIVCIFTDTGGYIFGKVFKGPRLTKVSPKKTYSGVFGSFLISLLFGLIYIKYLGQKSKILLETDLLFIILLILFISLVSQIGDLIISYFKRKAKLKDTGKILPGHGGFLDRIDGIIFVMPATYLLVLPILINKLNLIK